MGGLEVAIGLGLLVPVALRLTLALSWAQMLGTLAVFLIEPGRAFEGNNPLLLSTESEFIVKNLVLITAGLVIASTLHARPEESKGRTRPLHAGRR